MSMIPDEAIARLKKTLDMLSLRSPERRIQVEHIAETYRCARSTVYAELQKYTIKTCNSRKDKNIPRWKDPEEFIQWVEIIAAIKHKSLNRKGHHISTSQTIAMAERGFRDIRTCTTYLVRGMCATMSILFTD